MPIPIESYHFIKDCYKTTKANRAKTIEQIESVFSGLGWNIIDSYPEHYSSFQDYIGIVELDNDQGYSYVIAELDFVEDDVKSGTVKHWLYEGDFANVIAWTFLDTYLDLSNINLLAQSANIVKMLQYKKSKESINLSNQLAEDNQELLLGDEVI